MINNTVKASRNAKLITALHKDDILEAKFGTDKYGLMKVSRVSADTVYVHSSLFECNMVSKLDEVLQKGFAGEEEAIPQAHIKTMFDKGKILDIQRSN